MVESVNFLLSNKPYKVGKAVETVLSVFGFNMLYIKHKPKCCHQ